MARNIFIGNSSGLARRVKKVMIGDSTGKARKIKKIMIGDSTGKARQIWPLIRNLKFISSASFSSLTFEDSGPRSATNNLHAVFANKYVVYITNSGTAGNATQLCSTQTSISDQRVSSPGGCCFNNMAVFGNNLGIFGYNQAMTKISIKKDYEISTTGGHYQYTVCSSQNEQTLFSCSGYPVYGWNNTSGHKIHKYNTSYTQTQIFTSTYNDDGGAACIFHIGNNYIGLGGYMEGDSEADNKTIKKLRIFDINGTDVYSNYNFLSSNGRISSGYTDSYVIIVPACSDSSVSGGYPYSPYASSSNKSYSINNSLTMTQIDISSFHASSYYDVTPSSQIDDCAIFSSHGDKKIGVIDDYLIQYSISQSAAVYAHAALCGFGKTNKFVLINSDTQNLYLYSV